MSKKRNYKDKVILITGASGGLGHALCKEFLDLGAKVVGCDLRPSAEPHTSESFLFIECDVTQPDACARTIQQVKSKWGRLDVLINNAGISHQSHFRSTDVSVLQKVMNVNFFGSVNLTKAALEDLISAKGQIIVVSSIAGFAPLLERTGYCASKHALHGFFDTLRAEVESLGVCVSIVCPSFVATGIGPAATRKTVGKESTPQEMAHLIIRGAEAQQELILPTTLSKLSWWTSRLVPKFYKKQMKKKVARSTAGALALVFLFYASQANALQIFVRGSDTHQVLTQAMVTEAPVKPVVLDTSDQGFPKPNETFKNDFWLTRFTDERGSVVFSHARTGAEYRIRKQGYKDKTISATSAIVSIELEPEKNSLTLARAKPPSSWIAALDLGDLESKKQFRMQCGFCHQQGNLFTQMTYSPEMWEKTIQRMIRYGSRLPTDLQKRLPEVLPKEWARLQASPELVLGPRALDKELKKVEIKEWPIGTGFSQTHDQLFADNGLVYVADNIQDRIWETDPIKNTTAVYKIPHREGEKNGGLISGRLKDFPNHDSTSNAHSLAQSKVDGHIFITPSAQRRLVEFDPKTKKFELHEMKDGFYPHTIRIDDKDQVWFTLALSNQIAKFDRSTKTFKIYDLPARGLKEKLTTRYIGFLFKLMSWGLPISNWMKIDWDATGVPLPYGIDITPDQKVWFARLHTKEIGVIDPKTDQVEMIATPFLGPRRLRTDDQGRLWITSYGDSLIARYDPSTREFKTYDLPVVPAGHETPYALNVDKKRQRVWVTGNQSNTSMILDMKSEKWTVVPLPRHTTFTRDFEFSPTGLAYTSNSNFPSWHAEGGQPMLLEINVNSP